MTLSGHPQATPATLPAEAEVVSFLRANPTFLDRHPELLRQMSIPHASGDAVSLLERQVTVLREDNQKLRRQFEELVGHARRNESLNKRVHALVLKLMNAAGPPITSPAGFSPRRRSSTKPRFRSSSAPTLRCARPSQKCSIEPKRCVARSMRNTAPNSLPAA